MIWSSPDDPGDSLVWENHVVAEALTALLGLVAAEVWHAHVEVSDAPPVRLVFEVEWKPEGSLAWAACAAGRLAASVGLPVLWQVEQRRWHEVTWPVRTLFMAQALDARARPAEAALGERSLLAEGMAEGAGGEVGRAVYDWVDYVAASMAEAASGLIPTGVQALGVRVHDWDIEVLAAGVGLDEQAMEDVEDIAGELDPLMPLVGTIDWRVVTPEQLAAQKDVRLIYADAAFMELLARQHGKAGDSLGWGDAGDGSGVSSDRW